MLIMDGAQIDFDPWRSNLRKSSAVEYSGATLISRSVFLIVHYSPANNAADRHLHSNIKVDLVQLFWT